jgi:hypothetical protein
MESGKQPPNEKIVVFDSSTLLDAKLQQIKLNRTVTKKDPFEIEEKSEAELLFEFSCQKGL